MKFIIYSILGYLIECIYTSSIKKSFNYNRGMLMGPYCPIYGISLSITNIVIESDLLFMWKVIIICIFIFFIEYSTSFFLEKFLHRSWWNYSKKKYNINGRVCLDNLIFFVAGSIFVGININPKLNLIFNIINNLYVIIVFLLFVIFLLDCFLSLKKYIKE